MYAVSIEAFQHGLEKGPSFADSMHGQQSTELKDFVHLYEPAVLSPNSSDSRRTSLDGFSSAGTHRWGFKDAHRLRYRFRVLHASQHYSCCSARMYRCLSHSCPFSWSFSSISKVLGLYRA
jgi:hypothetical protein